MNRWYEASFIYDDISNVIKFELLQDNDIISKFYMELQDWIFAKILISHINKSKNLSKSLILAGYDVELEDSYEYMKSVIVPIYDIKKYTINYIKEIIPCEGCKYESGNQYDHMGYNGCI